MRQNPRHLDPGSSEVGIPTDYWLNIGSYHHTDTGNIWHNVCISTNNTAILEIKNVFYNQTWHAKLFIKGYLAFCEVCLFSHGCVWGVNVNQLSSTDTEWKHKRNPGITSVKRQMKDYHFQDNSWLNSMKIIFCIFFEFPFTCKPTRVIAKNKWSICFFR